MSDVTNAELVEVVEQAFWSMPTSTTESLAAGEALDVLADRLEAVSAELAGLKGEIIEASRHSEIPEHLAMAFRSIACRLQGEGVSPIR